MNKFKLFIFGGLILFFASCADEDARPIITFDDAGKGAYPRLISEGVRDINLFDIANSAYVYTVEFVDLEQGNLVSTYDLQYTFEDNNPDIGGDTSTGPNPLRSFSSSEFSTNSNGFQGIENVTVTATELLAAAGMSADDLGPGDVFRITGSVTTTDGQTFASGNSSASVQGAAFRGHFNFNMAAACPSDLNGTYDSVTLDTWCGSDRVPNTTQVTFTLTATGYDVTDFSFGAYDLCYGPTSARPLGNLRFLDICNVIEITGASQWGEVYTWSDFSVDGEVLQFTWVNDYGEGGTSQVIRPGGWPPLTLK